MPASTNVAETYSPMQTVLTTAMREIQFLLRSKGVGFTLAITLIAIVGLTGFGAWQKNKNDDAEAPAIAAVNLDSQYLTDAGYDGRAAANLDEAVHLVRDGDVEAAVVVDGSQWQVMSDGLPSSDIMTGIDGLADAYARTAALAELGVSPADYEAAAPQIDVVAVDVDEAAGEDTDSESSFARLFTALIALSVVVLSVITFAAQVGSRVTEEKSSRVIELILASVRPLDFLAGKLLGALAYGFLATSLLIIVGAVSMQATGLLEGIDFDWSIFPILLVSWLLGMLFFGGLYAAAGAMVQRTEDLQSTQMPILLLLMASAYVPAFGWSATGATWMQVMSWIPPFSIFAAPLSYAAGDFTAAQLLGSFAIATAVTVVVVWFAARVYQRTILNNGRVTKWSEALRLKQA